MAKVELKSVKGYPDYSVNTDGVVFSHKRGQTVEIRGSVWMGYRKVTLSNGGKTKTIAVHRLVAETFLTRPRGSNVVNHIDGNKGNNKLSNLEWTTHEGNSRHCADKLTPGYKEKRVKQKQDLVKAKQTILHTAYAEFQATGSPEEFMKIYRAVHDL